MLDSKLFLSATTAVLLISVFLSIRFLSNNHSGDDRFRDDDGVEGIPIDGGAFGPESLAFDPVGGTGPYTGVSDGRIIKWQAIERRWIDFAVTSPNRDRCDGSMDNEEMERICGRPLGLKFDQRTKNLYIADANFGLLVVGPNGGLATILVSEAQGLPLKFTNALDVDQRNGLIYFTDSSQRYTRRDHTSIVISGDKTGSLIKYNLESKEVTVLLHNLSFPNGVALSQNRKFLLVAETTNCRILRFWLQTSKAGTVEVFTDLPGYPDNITRNRKGEFWVAMYSRKSNILRWIHSKPWIENVLTKLPVNIVKGSSYISKLSGQGLAVKLGVDGDILEMLEDVNGKIWRFASEVMESDGYLWIGSVINHFLVKLKIYN